MTKQHDKEPIQIVFIMDNNYVIATCVAIQSLYENRDLKSKYVLHIVCDNVKREYMDLLNSISTEEFKIELLNFEKPELHKTFEKENTYVSTSATLKFLLPKLFPDIDKLLYIDGDILIQSDLIDLFNTDISNVYAGVIKDFHGITFKGNVWERLNVTKETILSFFNSGVMLLNLAMMRQDNITEKLIDYRINGINYYMDQDALNIVFGRKVKYLNFNYNMILTNWRNKSSEELSNFYKIPFEKDKYDYLRKAEIVHFASQDKPWDYYDTFFSDVWYYYYLLSCVNNIPLNRQSLNDEIKDETIQKIRVQNKSKNKDNYYWFHKSAVPIISIIIPVYNAEKYLEECIESVLCQSIWNYEIICVDDGSTDKSREILRKYQNMDDRIVIVEQKNQYAGVARNNGLKLAKGQYVLFLDSDDILPSNALEQFHSKAIADNADVIIGQLATVTEKSGETIIMNNWLNEKYLPLTDVFSAKDIMPFIFNFTPGGPGGKCFKKSFIEEKNLKFLTLPKSEDFYFVHRGIVNADVISLIRNLVYCRRDVPNSLENSKDKNPLIIWEAIVLMKNKLIEDGLYEVAKQSFINENINRLAFNLRTMNTEEGFSLLKNKLEKIYLTELGIGFYPETYYYKLENYNYLCKLLGLPTSSDNQEVSSNKNDVKQKKSSNKSVSKVNQEVSSNKNDVKQKKSSNNFSSIKNQKISMKENFNSSVSMRNQKISMKQSLNNFKYSKFDSTSSSLDDIDYPKQDAFIHTIKKTLKQLSISKKIKKIDSDEK